MTNIQKKNFNSSQSKPKSCSWSENFQEVRIESMGRNIVIPKSKIGSQFLLGEEDKIPIYRAEADPNQRLDSSGVIEKRSKKGKEPMLFVNIGGDTKRTEDFMSQARERETKTELAKAKDFQKSLRKSFYDINRDANFMKESNQYDYRESLNKAAKEYKEYIFDASGQTIRSSYISRDLGKQIMASSLPEHLNDINALNDSLFPESKPFVSKKDLPEMLFEPLNLGSKEVMNVDITKSHNQFGIGGNTLQQLKRDIAKNGVQEGTTYNNRRRSEPMLYETKSLDLSGPRTRLDDVLIDSNVRGSVAGRR